MTLNNHDRLERAERRVAAAADALTWERRTADSKRIRAIIVIVAAIVGLTGYLGYTYMGLPENTWQLWVIGSGVVAGALLFFEAQFDIKYLRMSAVRKIELRETRQAIGLARNNLNDPSLVQQAEDRAEALARAFLIG